MSCHECQCSKPIKIKIKNISNNPNPEYAHSDDSGMDIRAWVDGVDFKEIFDSQKTKLEDGTMCLVIHSNKTLVVPTGIFVEIPEGYEIQFRSRSGLAAKTSISILNSPGTIDAGYRGELKAILHNHSNVPYIIRNGDKVGQLVLQKVPKIEWVLTDDSLSITNRGEKGFGSTGV